MDDTRIQLVVLWVVLMLTYLLGDVMRIFVGDFVAGEIAGEKAGQWVWIGAALMMLIPIVMAYLSLVLNQPAARWASIILAGVLFLFNLVGLPGYPRLYDKFLIVVGLGWNVLTILTAWPPSVMKCAGPFNHQRNCRKLKPISMTRPLPTRP